MNRPGLILALDEPPGIEVIGFSTR
jgi:hypothetical protein